MTNRGKIIVIEGSDSSGKETQSNLLLNRLKKEYELSGKNIVKLSFPMYESPTGKIVGGPYLGKEHISKGYFEEGAVNVPAKVASLYYAADRYYNMPIINKYLEEGTDVILDRYVTSNMAHQAGKIDSKEERYEMYNWLCELEYNLLNLPKPDITIFLHMSVENALILREKRSEAADEHESNIEHLNKALRAYLELAELYDFKTITCGKSGCIKTIEEIHEEVYEIVKNNI